LVVGVWLMGMSGCDFIPQMTEAIFKEEQDREKPEEPPPSILEINAQPANYLDKEIVLEGILDNQNENYFTEPLKLVLENSKGDKIRVIPWLPLEVPPGPDIKSPKKPVQSDFLDQTVKLTGTIQLKDGTAFLKVSHAEIIG
jgi:hypothetical protein